MTHFAFFCCLLNWPFPETFPFMVYSTELSLSLPLLPSLPADVDIAGSTLLPVVPFFEMKITVEPLFEFLDVRPDSESSGIVVGGGLSSLLLFVECGATRLCLRN